MIVCATGHRPDKLGGYSEELGVRRTEIAMAWLETQNVSLGITGMALGWDQDFALACYELNIPYLAAVPFEGQESRWGARSQRIYRWLMNRASEIRFIYKGGYSSSKMLGRNIWMVDESDHVLALYDGSPGGTGHCMRYAREWEKPITNLYQTYIDSLDDDVPF